MWKNQLNNYNKCIIKCLFLTNYTTIIQSVYFMHTHINSVDNNLLITCVLFMTECNTPPLRPTQHLYNSELNLAVRC